MFGLLPGIGGGAYLLALIDPGWLKLGVYAVLLPLMLMQAAGVRRPLKAERMVGVTFGRSCMSFDVWIIGFGLSRVLNELAPGASVLGYGVWAIAVALDIISWFASSASGWDGRRWYRCRPPHDEYAP